MSKQAIIFWSAKSKRKSGVPTPPIPRCPSNWGEAAREKHAAEFLEKYNETAEQTLPYVSQIVELTCAVLSSKGFSWRTGGAGTTIEVKDVIDFVNDESKPLLADNTYITSIGYDVRNVVRTCASAGVLKEALRLPSQLWLYPAAYMDIESIMLPTDLGKLVPESYMFSCFGLPATFKFGQSTRADVATSAYICNKLGVQPQLWTKSAESALLGYISSLSGIRVVPAEKEVPLPKSPGKRKLVAVTRK